jgi:nucleotide-binding universal stress UspA family protein
MPVRPAWADNQRMAMTARRIVVGFDGSEASEHALEAAADLAGYGSSLAVVSVAHGPFSEPADRARSEVLLARARARLQRRQVTARYLGPVGDAAQQLIEAVQELDADLLVVGRRNGRARHRLLGSVSSKVVRGAPCDVLVIR